MFFLDFVGFTFQQIGSAINSMLNMFHLEIADGVFIDYSVVVFLLFLLSLTPRFIRLIFGSKGGGIPKHGRE